MITLGIKSIITKRFPKKKTRLTDEEKSNIVNLIKNINITHLNQVWTTDITYINTINEKTFSLVSYLDYYSKKVVAWNLFENQKTDVILSVLKIAIKKRAYREIYNYIEGFYNPIRIHSSIGYLSPNDFENLNKFDNKPL